MHPDILERDPFCLNTVEPPVCAVTPVTAELKILFVIIRPPIGDFPSVFHHASRKHPLLYSLCIFSLLNCKRLLDEGPIAIHCQDVDN
jgi:hypothetical protein